MQNEELRQKNCQLDKDNKQLNIDRHVTGNNLTKGYNKLNELNNQCDVYG